MVTSQLKAISTEEKTAGKVLNLAFRVAFPSRFNNTID